MSQPQGTCVFCGETGLTKGHIWPEWFGKFLTLDADENLLAIEPSAKVAGPEAYQKIKQGHSASRKPRNTCLNCNTGWMSLIENEAIPTLSTLMLDSPQLLGPIEQIVVSRLLCLMTIRFEFLETTLQAVPPEDRNYLRINRWIPPRWNIWIARYHGEKGDAHWCKHWGVHAMPSPTDQRHSGKCNTQTTTMVLGKLCAHMFSTTLNGHFIGYSGKPLTRIWPPSYFYIDTQKMSVLTDEEIVALHNALADNLQPVGDT